jgi:hypothetical protein
MFRLRFFSLAALAGLLLVFNSCERHHVGELPELQAEHTNPLDPAAKEAEHGNPVPEGRGSPTPADFFPKEKP